MIAAVSPSSSAMLVSYFLPFGDPTEMRSSPAGPRTASGLTAIDRCIASTLSAPILQHRRLAHSNGSSKSRRTPSRTTARVLLRDHHLDCVAPAQRRRSRSLPFRRHQAGQLGIEDPRAIGPYETQIGRVRYGSARLGGVWYSLLSARILNRRGMLTELSLLPLC